MDQTQPNSPNIIGQPAEQTSELRPRISFTRNIVGILTAGLGGYVAYILAVVVINDLGTIYVAPAAAALVGFVALWLINKDSILQAAATSVLTIWLMYNLTSFGLQNQIITYVLIALSVTAAYVFHRYIFGFISRRYGIIFIVVAILLGFGYMYAGMGLRIHQSNSERKQNLEELDFLFYQPSYVPAGYVLAETYASVGSSVDQAYIHTNLDKQGGGAIFINQFKTLSLYKPPVNCGPDSTVIVNPDRPLTPCKEIATSKVGCTVYREITHRPAGLSGGEQKLILSNAYCNLKGTTIVIQAYDYQLSNEEVVKIIDSMTVAGGQPIGSFTQSEQESPDIKYFIITNPIPIDRIKRVSKFRSCVQPYQNGANALSEPETNRSLGHHYQLSDGIVVNIGVVAPFDSVIEAISAKDGGGTEVRLASDSSSWRLVVSLTSLTAGLREGSVVKVGEALGYINIRDDFKLDLVKSVGSNELYDSIFSHLSNSVTADFAKYGVTSTNITISKADRDANSCTSQSNKISDWVDLKR